MRTGWLRSLTRALAGSGVSRAHWLAADEIAKDGHVKVVIIDGVQYLSMRDIVQAVTPGSFQYKYTKI